MVEYIGREVLLKDQNGEVIIPYVSYASSGRNVGDIFYTTRTDTELNGAVECNGGTYNTDDFSGSQSIGNLLSGGKVPYVSLTEYESVVTANGSCRAFGWDGGTSFRVPLLNDVYIEAGNAVSVGEFIKESLPNITGYFKPLASNQTNVGFKVDGAFYEKESETGNNVTNSSGTGNVAKTIGLDASRSSSTYQNGAKVKPDSVRYRAMVQLAISTTDEAVITATSALQQIVNKADVDLNNLSSLGRDYIDSRIFNYMWGSSAYIKLWVNSQSKPVIIQWGTASSGSTVAVTLPTAFTTTSYKVVANPNRDSGENYSQGIKGLTTTGFTIRAAGGAANGSAFWIAIGY